MGVEIGDEQRHRMGLGEGPEALLARLELLLDRLLSADVDVKAADLRDVALAVPDREADHHAPAVLVEVGGELLDHLGASALEHGTIVLGDQRGVVADAGVGRGQAQHLRRWAAEHLGHLRIGEQIAAVEILQVHADRSVLHERRQPRLAGAQRLLDPLAVADVGDRGDHRPLPAQRSPPAPTAAPTWCCRRPGAARARDCRPGPRG